LGIVSPNLFGRGGEGENETFGRNQSFPAPVPNATHAVFMPFAARPVGRLPPSFVPDQQLEPGFGDVPTLSTRPQRFTHVRLTTAYLTGAPAFSATLTTSAIVPAQLAVV